MRIKDHGLLLFMLGVSAGVEWISDWIDLLQYERDAILDGELWRLVSAHLVHGTHLHWLLNSLGLILVWAIYPAYFRRPGSLVFVMLLAVCISAQLLVLSPEVTWYLGMSALLHGLFAAWSLLDVLSGRRLAALPLCLVVAKVLYEQYAGASPGVVAAIGLPVLVDAHLYGVMAGVVLAVVMYPLAWWRRA